MLRLLEYEGQNRNRLKTCSWEGEYEAVPWASTDARQKLAEDYFQS